MKHGHHASVDRVALVNRTIFDAAVIIEHCLASLVGGGPVDGVRFWLLGISRRGSGAGRERGESRGRNSQSSWTVS